MVLLGACGGGERECPEAPTTGAEAPVVSPVEPMHEPRVIAGTCETSWLPAGTARDLSDADEAALASAVREWLAGEGYRVQPGSGGIVFAKSEDDRGDDPPYPPEASALAARACGLGARWLVDHLRARLEIPAGPDGEGLVCDENVCCFAGMEFVPHGTVVFARDAERDVWTVESALFVSEAALSEETVSRNRAFVAGALGRLAGASCEGEPLFSR